MAQEDLRGQLSVYLVWVRVGISEKHESRSVFNFARAQMSAWPVGVGEHLCESLRDVM